MIGPLPKPVPIKTTLTFLTAWPRISLHTWADVISYTVTTVLAGWTAHGWKKEKHIKVQHLMNENHTCVLWTDDGHQTAVRWNNRQQIWHDWENTLKAPTFHKPWSNPDIRVIPHHQKHLYQAAVSSHYANHSSPWEAAAEESIYIHIKRPESGAMAWAQDFNRIQMVFRAGPFYRFKVQ